MLSCNWCYGRWLIPRVLFWLMRWISVEAAFVTFDALVADNKVSVVNDPSCV